MVPISSHRRILCDPRTDRRKILTGKESSEAATAASGCAAGATGATGATSAGDSRIHASERQKRANAKPSTRTKMQRAISGARKRAQDSRKRARSEQVGTSIFFKVGRANDRAMADKQQHTGLGAEFNKSIKQFHAVAIGQDEPAGSSRVSAARPFSAQDDSNTVRVTKARVRGITVDRCKGD